jgi:hypothetical protein
MIVMTIAITPSLNASNLPLAIYISRAQVSNASADTSKKDVIPCNSFNTAGKPLLHAGS